MVMKLEQTRSGWKELKENLVMKPTIEDLNMNELDQLNLCLVDRNPIQGKESWLLPSLPGIRGKSICMSNKTGVLDRR